MSKFCNCRDCKKARRKGLVLGTRRYGTFHVSAYVPHPRFAKGKRIRRPNNPENPE